MFNYKWYLKDGFPAQGIEKNNLNIFSCFACGGGSTMGYKLAGYNVLGCNEIDPKIIKVYEENHKPQFSFNEDIRTFKIRDDLPKELYNLDILDGSPPCSSFSIAGSREKDWGKKKVFREGQAEQTLDDLFFDFLDLANKLKPKVIVAENVKGMLIGNAKAYTKKILNRYAEIGYTVQLFLLNAGTMGVPQKRERVFFIARRNDLKFPKLKMEFNEKVITIEKAIQDMQDFSKSGVKLTDLAKEVWNKTKIGNSAAKVKNGNWFNRIKLNPKKICTTITAKSITDLWHWKEPYYIAPQYIRRLSTFPEDYNSLDCNIGYLAGMSVPPVVMARVSLEIFKQWLDN